MTTLVSVRPTHPNHMLAYDLMEDRTDDRRAIKILTVIDEFSRESLAIVVERRLDSDDVLQCLSDLFLTRGPPEHIRSDNGSEFIAQTVRQWLQRTGVQLSTSSAVGPAKMATVKVSTGSSETRFWIERSSAH